MTEIEGVTELITALEAENASLRAEVRELKAEVAQLSELVWLYIDPFLVSLSHETLVNKAVERHIHDLD